MNFNPILPELSVSNLQESLNFYINTLGFKKEYERSEKKFAFLSYQGTQLMLEEINNHFHVGELEKPFGRGINFQIRTNEVEALLQRIEDAGHSVFKEIEENWYRVGNQLSGNKEFLVQDLDGYLLRFSEDLGYKNI